MGDHRNCPLCNGTAQWSGGMSNIPNLGVISGCHCPPYMILHQDIEYHLKDSEGRTKWQPQRLCTLLWERDYKGLSFVFLQFEQPNYPDVSGFVPVSAADLLRTWPHEIPRRIDRCLCNLVNAAKKERLFVGQPYNVALKDPGKRILFTEKTGEKEFFINALSSYGWIVNPDSISEQRQLTLTPKGYARYDELTHGQASSKNPAFVAMWFGGKNRKEDMSQLFEDHIERAINNAGYRALRVDRVEHNDQIMDRVHEFIRQAPFVVAELSEDNRGVYYEAGFARGLGTDVIYCCLREKQKHLHFDVTAINIVIWDTPEDLCERLERRVLGSIKQGPYLSDELARAPRSVPRNAEQL